MGNAGYLLKRTMIRGLLFYQVTEETSVDIISVYDFMVIYGDRLSMNEIVLNMTVQ